MNIDLNLKQKSVASLLEFITLLGDEAGAQEAPKVKISLLQLSIDQYKQLRDRKNELSEKLTSLDSEMQNMETNTGRVSELEKIKERLLFEINKFGNISTDESLHSKVINIKTNRINQLINLFKNYIGVLPDQNQHDLELGPTHLNHLAAKPLLFLLALVPALTIFVYLYQSTTLVLFSGAFFFLLLLFIYIIINAANPVLNLSKGLDLDYEEKGKKVYNEFLAKLNTGETEFLVNAAWIEALKTELSKIETTIKRFSGDEESSTPENKQSERMQAASETNKLLDSMITAEQYLSLRRELDIVKIEADSEVGADLSVWEIAVSGLESLSDNLRETITGYLDFLREKQGVKVHYQA